MRSSKQLTKAVNDHSTPEHAEFLLWKNTRYLIAQHESAAGFSDTVPGYFRGHHVVPGPKANPKVSAKLNLATNEQDFQLLKYRYYIRFTDNVTTERADDSIGRAIYRIMTDSEADEYEKILAKHNKG